MGDPSLSLDVGHSMSTVLSQHLTCLGIVKVKGRILGAVIYLGSSQLPVNDRLGQHTVVHSSFNIIREALGNKVSRTPAAYDR